MNTWGRSVNKKRKWSLPYIQWLFHGKTRYSAPKYSRKDTVGVLFHKKMTSKVSQTFKHIVRFSLAIRTLQYDKPRIVYYPYVTIGAHREIIRFIFEVKIIPYNLNHSFTNTLNVAFHQKLSIKTCTSFHYIFVL